MREGGKQGREGPCASAKRSRLLEELAGRVLQMECPHPRRLAVDGIDAAGKTTLADELAVLLEGRGCPVIRASLDGFHRPRAERYRRGADSPEGYYHDSYDYPAMLEALLRPLGPNGDRRYRTALFDFRSDAPLETLPLLAPADALLIVDGIFLLRPELNPSWDFRLFVEISFETCIQRAVRRDLSLFGSPEAVRQRYEQRYLPAQRLYLQTVRPAGLAEAVIDNNDPANPAWKKLPEG